MGPEPYQQFDPMYLSHAVKQRSMPIKNLLLDQKIVAGIGNIYACEALFRAGISPKRKASTIAGKRADRLVPAIQSVLRDAISQGGTSLKIMFSQAAKLVILCNLYLFTGGQESALLYLSN